MGVAVWYHPGWLSNGYSPPLPSYFADADDYRIDDGDLFVIKNESQMAVIAAGVWSVVQLVEEEPLLTIDLPQNVRYFNHPSQRGTYLEDS
jgi:hypothetical protein